MATSYVKQSLTVNGGGNGILTVSTAAGFSTGAICYLVSDTLTTPISLIVDAVLNSTQIAVKPANAQSYTRFDCAGYLVVDNAVVTQPAQMPGNSDFLGQESMSMSMPVTLASDQPPIPVIVVSGGGGGGVPVGFSTEAQQIAGNASLVNIDTKLPSLGQDLMAASFPVVLASDQTAVPVSATALPLPLGAATAALQTQPGVDIGDVTVNNAAGVNAINIQDGGNSITVDATSLPLPTGAATEATLALVKAKTDNLDVLLSTRAITGLTDAQLRASAIPVSATALPLPLGAATAALQTQPGVDIGDVTVNNAAGASAVNIQDGGNSITVDAASLPLPTGAATEATLALVKAKTDNLDVALSSRGSKAGKVSTLNSSTTPLGIGASFIGDWEDTLDYGAVGVTWFSDKDSQTGGAYLQWSSNGALVDITDKAHFVSANVGDHYHSDLRARYFRVVYINDGTAQTVFRLQTILHATAPTREQHPLRYAPTTETDANVVQSVIYGNVLGKTDFIPVQLAVGGALRTFDVNVDSFGRSLSATPTTLFDSKMLLDNAPLYWDDAVISGAGTSSTYNAGQASNTLTVSNLTAGFRARQTFQRMPYQPGKSSVILCTGIIGAATAGITRNIGYFSSENGVMFRSAPTGVQVVIRSKASGAVVDVPVPQLSWNIDKMNGTGPTGINLDFSKTQIFVMMFQWLGVGAVWFGFNVSGETIWCHRVDHANSFTTVYMSTPNLPVRYDIQNDGTGAGASLTQICCSVISEGGAEEIGVTRSIYRTAAFAAANDALWYPLIALRLKAGSTYSQALVQLKKLSVSCSSTASYVWRLVLNPTIVGTAFTYTGLTNSAVEYTVSTTNATTITGGTDVDAGVVMQQSESKEITLAAQNLRMGSSIADVKDVWVFAVSRVIGGAEDYLASLTFLEQT